MLCDPIRLTRFLGAVSRLRGAAPPTAVLLARLAEATGEIGPCSKRSYGDSHRAQPDTLSPRLRSKMKPLKTPGKINSLYTSFG